MRPRLDSYALGMSGLENDERFSKLLSLTDASLSHLDLYELLRELLDRIRVILEADTAAVLLLAPDADELVATATYGLEDEVRQGVTVPIGSGFAGSIALHRQPIILEQVDTTTVANPILWEKGVRKMLGVPMLINEQLLGVLHVGRLQDRSFTQDDAILLQVASDRVAGAVQTQQLAAETAAARLLERGLQPSRLPDLPGLRMAGRYVPAESRSIGGDWYDAFTVPTGELWIVAGDVAGHGLSAAVLMGRVKSALRSYSLVERSPARVLELTDRKVLHFEIGTIVTVVCLVSAPPFDEFEICSAGHLPPVLARPGGATTLVAPPVGPPLGVKAGISRASTTVGLPPGGVLLAYTDGLVERREETIDEGLERLRQAVVAQAPDAVCRSVMHDLVGGTSMSDDIALLAVQRR